MLDIGFTELVVIAIVGLLVIGPERLPEALRTLGLWIGRMRRSFTNVKTEIEKEIGMDEIRRQLHNEAVMEEMKRIERDVRHSVDSTTQPPTGTEPSSHKSDAGTPADYSPEPHPDSGRLPADQASADAPSVDERSGDETASSDTAGRDDDKDRG